MAVAEDKKRLSVSFPKDLLNLVEEDARDEGKSVSKFVSDLVAQMYEAKGRYQRPLEK
jgi:metal-responsive CopG/Arc/MetJ family transcriptional regulator